MSRRAYPWTMKIEMTGEGTGSTFRKGYELSRQTPVCYRKPSGQSRVFRGGRPENRGAREGEGGDGGVRV